MERERGTWVSDGERYIGDLVFEGLKEIEGFREEARRLIEGDWRKGRHAFENYVEPLIEQLPFEATHPSWGDLSIAYVERRLMTGLDIRSDPWLWTYSNLVGAHIDPDRARFALNAIESNAK
jgi:hypothetical protein